MSPERQLVLERLEQIELTLGSIYAPSPREAAAQREYRRDPPKSFDPVRVETRPSILWQGAALETKGFTLVNGFVTLNIRSDTLAGDGLVLKVELVGAEGGPSGVYDSRVVDYIGPGVYLLPVVRSNQILATSVYTRVVAESETNVRTIVRQGQGMVVAGFSQ